MILLSNRFLNWRVEQEAEDPADAYDSSQYLLRKNLQLYFGIHKAPGKLSGFLNLSICVHEGGNMTTIFGFRIIVCMIC
jgi:hypothetical protein